MYTYNRLAPGVDLIQDGPHKIKCGKYGSNSVPFSRYWAKMWCVGSWESFTTYSHVTSHVIVQNVIFRFDQSSYNSVISQHKGGGWYSFIWKQQSDQEHQKGWFHSSVNKSGTLFIRDEWKCAATSCSVIIPQQLIIILHLQLLCAVHCSLSCQRTSLPVPQPTYPHPPLLPGPARSVCLPFLHSRLINTWMKTGKGLLRLGHQQKAADLQFKLLTILTLYTPSPPPSIQHALVWV